MSNGSERLQYEVPSHGLKVFSLPSNSALKLKVKVW